MNPRCLAISLGLCLLGPVFAQEARPPQSAPERFAAAVTAIAALLEPATARTSAWSATLTVTDVRGLSPDYVGQSLRLEVQPPDRCRLETVVAGRRLVLGRQGTELWIHAPESRFAALGVPGRPLFATAPDKLDPASLDPIRLPLPREQLAVLPLLVTAEDLPPDTIAGIACRGLKVVPRPEALPVLKLPKGALQLWLAETDLLPRRLGWSDDAGHALTIALQFNASNPIADDHWLPPRGADTTVETVPLGHLQRFLTAALSLLTIDVPALGPAEGHRQVLAREGDGRLEDHDGTRVLFLKGSPQAMGRQHGTLLRRQVRNLVDRIVYGVGIGSSFEKGRWFLGEIEAAQARLRPFTSPRYLEESDALAQAAGLEPEEVRLANFFPELFHCSGFAVYGQATVDGRLYHGRILDYLKGVGLEPNAVVIVHQPDHGHAWVNVGYAGFVGTVTAMNEQHISIGEMGGRGEGRWDGKPMAHLLREVMEQAETLDEAIDILRRGPRTCEYYYVIADGNSRKAVGVAATPDTFELVWPGHSHPRLPHAIPDAVVLSAGDRYETLARRVLDQFGRLDCTSSRALMERPVAMKSNIHSVLFAPESLDFWVANADSKNVASHTRYTRYNLAELLTPPAVKP